MTKLSVTFYRERGGEGNEPARIWLKSLPVAERKIIGADSRVVQFRWPVGRPLVDSLGHGLWELRSNLAHRISRLIFLIEEGEIILLHGFVKKTQKTPVADLALARSRAGKWRRNETE